jgi:hypothetical protein
MVNLPLRVDPARCQPDEGHRVGRQFHVRVLDVIHRPGPAVDHHRQVAHDRPGESEHDAGAVRQSDLLTDDVANRAFYRVAVVGISSALGPVPGGVITSHA